MKGRLTAPRQESLAVPEIANPFRHEVKLGFLDMIQVVLMSITLAPLRLILAILLFTVACLLAALGVACRSNQDQTKPFHGWRLFLQKPFSTLVRGAFFFCGFFYVKTKGKRAPASVAPILALAPHSSFFDTLLIFLGSPLPSPVSRYENSKIPIFGNILKLMQPVLVQREDPDSRVTAIKEIQRRGQSGGKWPQIIIFPEGTCTNRSCLISFKLGAFYPGVPVQPVCVRYQNKLDTVTWTWEGPKMLSQLWLTLCQFYTRCEIEYLDVYTPSPTEIAVPRMFADNVRRVMAKCLQVSVTDHTFDDCRLMRAAEAMEMLPAAGLVEFEKLHSKLGVKFDEIERLLQRFNEIKTNKVSKEKASSLTYEEFSQYLLLPKSEALRQVFDLYDRDGSGTIDFREYVIGLSLISAPVNNDDTFDLAFQLFDKDGDGYISLDEFQSLLQTTFNMASQDVQKIFCEVNTSKDGKISMGEFKSYAGKKPEYAKIFTTYRELKMQNERQLSETAERRTINLAADFEQWASKGSKRSFSQVKTIGTTS